jgi:NAD(P)-dependent dehydrogenase (short-subunit alcohol dehydrogenase family)
MKTNRLLIVGANSDLIQPLFAMARSSNVELLPLRRQDWDLGECIPPKEVIKNIQSFSPNHLLYAAGINNIHQFHVNPVQSLQEVTHHFVVNCLSFLSVVSHLNSCLANKLISIHVLSSLYGVYGRRTRLPYSVSKHALEGAVKCLATELPTTLVLAYRPGFFATKLTNKNISIENQERLMQRIPAARLGQPAELSSVILRNILDPPFYATGTAITMDGGLTSGGIFQL